MRVPADKEFWRPRHQASDNGRIVLSRIASDVFYEYFRTVHRKTVHLRKQLPDFLPINIPVDCP